MTKNNTLVLLQTLRRSSSTINTIKYTNDKKKRSKAIGGIVGLGVLYFFLLLFCVLINAGFGFVGMADQIPIFTVIVISGMCLIFTFLKSDGYFFGIRDYEMLMSLPFDVQDIIKCKFLCMYIDNLRWAFVISVGNMIGYGLFAKPPVFVYILWIVLSLFIPVIPMVVAAALGTLIIGIGSGFKFKKAVQTILMFLLLFASFASRFIIDSIVKNNSQDEIMNGVPSGINKATGVLFYAPWFEGAILEFRISDILALIAVPLLVFSLFYMFVAKYYKKINTRMNSHSVVKNFKLKEQKKRSVVNAIVFKEFKRMVGSTNYMVNATFGHALVLIFAVVAIFVDADKLVSAIVNGAPVEADILIPAIPFIVYFFVGMVATTCISPSIEGKNNWILQSFPVKKMDIYKGKMLFNMYLAVPPSLFATIIFSIKFGADAVETILAAVLIFVLCCFSTTYGMVWGIKCLKLDWENEVEVVKQSTAVSGYLLTNMFPVMILIAGAIVGGFFLDTKIIEAIVTVIALILTVICYKSVEKRAQK